jgi:predicted nucleic acid-binding Zn ribbon protein
MSFEELNTVLVNLKKTRWQEQQSFEQLIDLWPSIVGAAVATQTRPLKISAQGVLYIAASSGAWAQTLAFERIRITANINRVWQPAIKDIYFSTREWHRQPPDLAQPPQSLNLNLSSVQRYALNAKQLTQPKDAQDAFSRWSQAIRHRAAHGYVPCPRCDCLVPPEEVQRWQCCALCASRPRVQRTG